MKAPCSLTLLWAITALVRTGVFFALEQAIQLILLVPQFQNKQFLSAV
jgi:hypothetical protein